MYRKKKKNQKFIIISIVAVVLVILLSISLLTTRSQNTILKSIGIDIQKVVMYPFTALNNTSGEIIGNVILKNFVKAPAPSSSHASYNSAGTSLKPERKINII